MINLTDFNDEFAAPAQASSRGSLSAFGTRLTAGLALLGQAMRKSRQDQANRSVASYFARQNDADLIRLGFSPADIQQLRAGSWLPTEAA